MSNKEPHKPEEWMLRTTEPASFRQAISEVISGKRTFLWFHAQTPEAKAEMLAECRAAGLDVLHTVPVWFVVACGADTPRDWREHMALSILEGAQVQYSTWRGVMFGYSEQEIAWYTREVDAAWIRYRKDLKG